MNIPILLETKWFLVLNKPAGLNVERLPQGFPSVEEWVEQYQIKQGVKKPFTGIVHRLDRPVSGVLLVAKKKMALKLLNEQFRQRKVKKQYLALVEGKPPKAKDQLTHWIEKDLLQKRAVAYLQKRNKTHKAILHYQTLREDPNTTLLKINPITGKFHQIRVQLSSIGCPIVGDDKYGATSNFKEDAIALQAQSLTFHDPVDGQKIDIAAEGLF